MHEQDQLIRVQAECYQLIKANQELSNVLQELMRMASVDSVQKLGQFIMDAIANTPVQEAPEAVKE